jgi:serine phosphatase RsbU (regulator of sigma subunit)
VDLITNTIVLSRNSHCPSIVITPEEGLTLLDEPAEPVGRKRGTRPQITELPLHLGTTVIVYTDGLKMAGARSTPIFDIPQAVRALRGEAVLDAAQLANQLLKRALELDDGRPRDDISVLVLRIVDSQGDGIRQMNVSIPI